VQRLAVDRVGAVARLERDTRDGGLALAGGAVPGGRGEVDGGLGDRLVGDLLGVLAGGLLALGPLALGEERVLALADDVDLEVGAGDLRAHARRRLLVVVLLGVGLRLGGRGGLGLGLGGRGSLGRRLGLRLGLDGRGGVLGRGGGD